MSPELRDAAYKHNAVYSTKYFLLPELDSRASHSGNAMLIVIVLHLPLCFLRVSMKPLIHLNHSV